MTGLLKAETRKLTSVRSWWVLMAGAAAFPVLTVVALAADPSVDTADLGSVSLASLVRSGASITAVAALILGILAGAGEYRHGTIIATVLAEPGRFRTIGAKLATLAAAGGVLAAATATTSVTTSGLYLRSLGVDLGPAPAGDVLAALGGVLLATALFGAIGAGIGAAVRNQTAAITGALVWILAIEGALPMFLRRPGLRDWLLTGAAERLHQLPDPAPGSVSAWAAVGLLVAVAAVGGLAAAAVTRLADIR